MTTPAHRNEICYCMKWFIKCTRFFVFEISQCHTWQIRNVKCWQKFNLCPLFLYFFSEAYYLQIISARSEKKRLAFSGLTQLKIILLRTKAEMRVKSIEIMTIIKRIRCILTKQEYFSETNLHTEIGLWKKPECIFLKAFDTRMNYYFISQLYRVFYCW